MSNDLFVNILDSANVKTASRLNSDQEFGILIDFTGNNRLLLVAAGHGTCHGNGTLTATDIKFFNQSFRIGANVLLAEEACGIGKFRFKITLQNKVILQ